MKKYLALLIFIILSSCGYEYEAKNELKIEKFGNDLGVDYYQVSKRYYGPMGQIDWYSEGRYSTKDSAQVKYDSLVVEYVEREKARIRKQ